jgi:hypothetical protein
MTLGTKDPGVGCFVARVSRLQKAGKCGRTTQQLAEPAYRTKGSEMVYKQDGLLQLTDSEVDAVARQFLSSPYADRTKYSDWPLDRRLGGFLHQRGLGLLDEDGDAHAIILDSVMAHLAVAKQPIEPTDGRGAPGSRGLPSLSPTGTDWSDRHRQYGDFEI